MTECAEQIAHQMRIGIDPATKRRGRRDQHRTRCAGREAKGANRVFEDGDFANCFAGAYHADQTLASALIDEVGFDFPLGDDQELGHEFAGRCNCLVGQERPPLHVGGNGLELVG